MTTPAHPNFMVAWEEIACQRGHSEHPTRQARIRLGGEPHGFHDYAQVPARLAREFLMELYDPEVFPVDGGPYCPAHDAVSATLVSLLIWEPRETILTLQACSTASEGQVAMDLGAQLGWFSLLAASCGLEVFAVEADADNLRALQTSAESNGWGYRIKAVHERLGPWSAALDADRSVRFVKMDLEGAEAEAVRVLWPLIEAGRVDHMLMEVSPVFADGYPELVERVMDAGFRAFLLPPKQQPPIDLDDPASALPRHELARSIVGDVVSGWHQEDIWLVRDGASW